MEINPFVPVTTPISLGYLAAYLKANGFSVEILALGQNSSLSRSSLKRLIGALRPSLVGLSAHQRTMLYVLGLADFVKFLDPEIRIAIGGPQATFMPSAALSHMPSVDYICRSSGEETILAVARAIERGAPFSDLAGVSYRDNDGNIFDTPAIEGSSDLDWYPSPYLDDVFDYSQMKEAIMLTSRGCPHNCIFCYTPRAFNRKITLHSVDRVIEEIRWLGKKGIRRLWFADPSISYQRERLETLLERMLSEGIEGEIWLQTRADLVNPGLMRLMRRVGVSTIAFGLESASERVRSMLRKKISIDRVREAVRMAQSHGIEVELFTMFGLPYESFDDALETLNFVKENRVKIMGNTNSQQMQIYFGTIIERHFEDYNIRPLHCRRPAYLSIGSQYETDSMTHEEIRRIQNIWSSQSVDGGRRVVS